MNPEYARSAQLKLSKISDESDFFPSIEGLQEGLTKKEFEVEYEHVESPAYKQQLSDIQSRVEALY